MKLIQIDTDKKRAGGNTKEYIVLHHTGVIGEGNVSVAKGESGNVSFHYLVMQDGRVYKIGSHDDRMRHAGESHWEGKEGLNHYSIGIEVESDGVKYTNIQKEEVGKLLISIMKDEGLSADKIIRHKDIAPDRKRDISDVFWSEEYESWEDYRLSLKEKEMDKKLYEDIMKAIMNYNGRRWHETNSQEERDLLHDSNEQFRKLMTYNATK